jgi:hypothetical protein
MYITIEYGLERHLTLTMATANQEWDRILEALGVGYLGIEGREGSLLRLSRVRVAITSRIQTWAKCLS